MQSSHRNVWRRWEHGWARGWVFDLLISLLALAGLAISAFWGFSLAKEQFAASDLKTLYASVWCFAHRQNAFAISNLQGVFTANGVVQPPTWFGHAPVYPPTTLMLLLPLAWLPMVPALYVALAVFVLLLAFALAAMLRYSDEQFGLGFFWRLAIAPLFAAGPLLGFALTMGNLSLAAAALVILAFVLRKQERAWLSGAMLAAALLLKPHIALWLAVCMLLLPQSRSRAVVLRAALFAGLAVGVTATFMLATGTIGMQLHGYHDILQAEMSGSASMSPASHEPLPVIAQITSLQSLSGYWLGNGAVNQFVSGAAVLVLAIALAWQTRRQGSDEGSFLAAGTWLAFGMLATYHRAHDAIALLILLPWVVLQVRRSPRSWYAWVAVVLYCVMSVGPGLDTVTQRVKNLPTYSFEGFVLSRQAGIAELGLFVVLMLALHRSVRGNGETPSAAEVTPLEGLDCHG